MRIELYRYIDYISPHGHVAYNYCYIHVGLVRDGYTLVLLGIGFAIPFTRRRLCR